MNQIDIVQMTVQLHKTNKPNLVNRILTLCALAFESLDRILMLCAIAFESLDRILTLCALAFESLDPFIVFIFTV